MSEATLSSTESLRERFRVVRTATESLIEPLTPEDCTIQTMPDVSPTKWHLAHTTWFFEHFVLSEFAPEYRAFDERFGFLFNSYYHTVGTMHARPARGQLSRPPLAEVLAYRQHVDTALDGLLATMDRVDQAEVLRRVTVGLHHEQQHQELLLMDIKHVLASNPLLPIYRPGSDAASRPNPTTRWVAFEHALDGARVAIGAEATDGIGYHRFSFDNERPRHQTLLRPFELASRPVTNGDWLEFLVDGGYRRVELWLSDGWTWVEEHRIDAPLYWSQRNSGTEWLEFTLHGPQPLALDAPVCHISFYEADAFARWTGARLPTEAELESACAAQNSSDGDRQLTLHPQLTANEARPAVDGLFGTVWQWTQSPYAPYPGFEPFAGSMGEYNGKFMCSQMTLRGSACITPPGHSRASYRNFFYPHQRWQMAGLRLAR